MSLPNHIFNLKSLRNQMEESSKTVPSMGEKVYQIFKGATTGSPAMIDEMIKVIERNSAKAVKYLQAKKKELKKLEGAK